MYTPEQLQKMYEELATEMANTGEKYHIAIKLAWMEKYGIEPTQKPRKKKQEEPELPFKEDV